MYKLVLTYDGTRYFGWQKTASGPTIQEELQKAIAKITSEIVLPEAASRTDRGVHAKGQVVQFALTKPMDPSPLQRALNAVLPSDIRIVSLEEKTFHPTLDALGKEYHYHLCLGPVQDPINRLYSWHYPHPIDTPRMNEAASHLIGTHDFTSFAGELEKDPICTLETIYFKDFFIIRGNRFLYKMVRALVGTLLFIGSGKLPPDCLPSILHSRDRKKGGMSAPAHGLYLHQVFYGIKWSHDNT